MPEPVRCLRGILADEVCRGVAVIAGCHRAMRRLAPAVELFAHNVAVGAGRRIVSEVGPTLGISEGIDANPDGNADNNTKQDALNRAKFHRGFRSPISATFYNSLLGCTIPDRRSVSEGQHTHNETLGQYP